jgi:hypothetical protein
MKCPKSLNQHDRRTLTRRGRRRDPRLEGQTALPDLSLPSSGPCREDAMPGEQTYSKSHRVTYTKIVKVNFPIKSDDANLRTLWEFSRLALVGICRILVAAI